MYKTFFICFKIIVARQPITQSSIFILKMIVVIMIGLHTNYCYADKNREFVPDIKGLSINTGYTYNPAENIFFGQIAFCKLYDYEKIWNHKAPDNLRFKIEGSLGASRIDNLYTKFISAAGIMALLYLKNLKTQWMKPYVEAGIGVIYTDYVVTRQAYRFNFNPVAGVGIEYKRNNNQNFFSSLRMHHLSNGGLNSKNRGQNSVVLIFGQYF